MDTTKCNRGHDPKYYIEPGRTGWGYCEICEREGSKFSQEDYDNAPRCPYCGDKRGYSIGTGDCNCAPSPDIGF